MKQVVIVGAGILGASVAHRLSRDGVAVTVLEAATPASGTSAASFAWVNAQDKEPPAYFDLNARGVEAYPRLAAEIGGDWFHPGGDIVVGEGAAADAVGERIARHEARGYPVTPLDRAGIVRLEPGLDLGRGTVVGAHFPSESWIDVPALVRRLLEVTASHGATLRTETPVVDFDLVGGRIAGVALADGERVPADEVLVAAGPLTERLAGLVGVDLPMSPSPGLLAVTEPVSDGVARVVHAAGVALRPDVDGRLLLSSRDVDRTLDATLVSMAPDEPEVADIVERAAAILPSVRGPRVDLVRVGRRSMPRDGFPAVGRAPAIDNLYVLASHSGVTLAPVLGRLVAAELAGRQEAALEPYRPARFTAVA